MKRRIGIVLALLLLVSGIGFTTYGAIARVRGQRALREVLDRQAAEGWGTSFTDLAALAPPVDRERQLRLRAWMKAPMKNATGLDVGRDLAWLLEKKGDAPPPAKVLEAHEAFRKDAEALEALFAEGDLCLTSLGWLPEHPETATFSERIGGWIPNLLKVRAATGWFAVESALQDDPTHAWEVMDRLHESTSRPGCLIDAMITIACDAMRDEAALVLALSDHLPEGRREAWLAEAPRAARIVADGMRGERLRFGAPLAQDLVEGRSLASHVGKAFDFADVLEGYERHLYPWAHAAAECAVYLDGMEAVEQGLRGEIARDEMDARLAPTAGLGSPFSLMIPNQLGIMTTALSSSDWHRLVRAAATLALEGRDRGRLPASEEEALAWVRARQPDLLPDEGETSLRYARLTENRFRMAVESEGDNDPLRLKEKASDRPIVRRGNAFIELLVP